MEKEYKFKEWIELEELKEQIVRAVEDVSINLPELIADFLSTALQLDKEEIEKKYWVETMTLFNQVCASLVPKIKIPLLSPQKKEIEKDEWDYAGRSWYFYSNKIAGTYGWNLEYIANLSVEDALSQIQEILTQEQLEREFQWRMSEACVSYDSSTKKSKFNPLPRPYWMQLKPKEVNIKKIKIPSGMLPIGNVDYSSISDDLKPKAIDPK